MLSSVDARAGLIHHWRGDGNATDSVGAHDGTELGGVNYSTGIFGQAFSFDGSDDLVDIGQKSIPISGDWSIAFWMKSATDQTVLAVPLSQGHNNTTGLTFQFQSFNNDNLSVGPRTDGHQMIIEGFSSADTVWHHLALTHNDTTLENTLYLDGLLANVHSSAGGAPGPTVTSWTNDFVDSGANLRFGNDGINTSRFWDGLLDDVRIYDNVLTAEDVAETMSAPEPASLLLIPATFGASILLKIRRNRRTRQTLECDEGA